MSIPIKGGIKMGSHPTAEKIKFKLARKRKLDAEIIKLLAESPRCFEGEPEKEEIYNFVISYFQSRNNQTKSTEAEKDPNSATSITLECVLYKIEQDGNHYKSLNVRMLTEIICDASDEDLILVPEEIKDKAFEIIVSYWEEVYS